MSARAHPFELPQALHGLGNVLSGLPSGMLGGMGGCLPSPPPQQMKTIWLDTICGPVEIPRDLPESGKGILTDVTAAVSKAIGEKLWRK